MKARHILGCTGNGNSQELRDTVPLFGGYTRSTVIPQEGTDKLSDVLITGIHKVRDEHEGDGLV